MRLIIITSVLLLIMLGNSSGAGKKISAVGNKHNFSYSNISASYHAIPTGDSPTYPLSNQICVFCHTPHRASTVGPLWNRKASQQSFFKHFSSSGLAIDDAAVRAQSGYGQPNGSSRLCLSCHDGVTALGAVFTTPGRIVASNIQFTDSKGSQGPDVKLSHETYSTHHPVSFKYDETVRGLLNAAPYNKNLIYNQPASNQVKLDYDKRMQCTTCHDPHQDKSNNPSPTHPFWTAGEYLDVCNACHNLVPSYPW